MLIHCYKSYTVSEGLLSDRCIEYQLLHVGNNLNQILWILEVLVVQSLLYIVEVSHI